MDTQTQIDRLIELAIIQRSELKQLVEQLPQLREHLNAEVEKVFDETEPQLRAELEEWTTKQTADKTAALGVALEAKIADLAKSLEVSTQARYNAIIAEREENARLAAQAEAKIAEHAASLPSAVKEIVSAELARFPRAGEIDQLRKEFAEPRGLNPRGKWQAGETYNKLDLVTINGDSYTSNTDGNRTRPSRSSADWTLVAARGTGGGGGPTSLSELTTVPSDGDLLIGSGTSWVTSNLTAGAGISITVGPGAITISATDGDITLDDGTAASPSLHFTNDPDTGIYRPAANTLGISTSGVQRMYVDQNGITTVGAGGTFDGSVHAANGNANNPSFSFTSDQDTGFYRHGTNELGISIGGTEKAVMTSTTFSITPNVSTSGNLTVSGAGNSSVAGNLGIGETSPVVPLHVKTTGTGTGDFDNAIATLRSTAAGRTITLQFSDTTNQSYISSKSGALNFGVGGATLGMSLSSGGNLTVSGTGTSSVAGNLALNGATSYLAISPTTAVTNNVALQLSVDVADNRAIRMTNTASGGHAYDFIPGGGGDAGSLGLYDNTAGSYRLFISGTGNATLAGNLTVSGTGNSTFAGNVGIGSTSIPAWSSHNVLQTSDLASFGSFTGNKNAQVMHNAFWNGSAYKYIETAAASYYAQTAGVHSWFTAASGTAGNTITFAEAARITSGGNVLIGTTTDSGNGKLQLATHTTSAGGIGFGTDTSWYRSQGGVLTLDTSANFQGFEAKKNGTLNFNFYSNSSDTFIGYKGTGSLTIQTLTGSPALTLDSSQNATFAGNVVLGAGKRVAYSASAYMTPENNVDGAEIASPGQFTVKTASTQALKIDSSQNATFAGDVGLSGNEKYLNLFSTYIVGSNSRARLRAVGSGGGSGYGGSFTVDTRTSGNTFITALTIDDAQNATFAGNLTVSGTNYNYVGGNKFFRGFTNYNVLYTGATELSINNQADGANLASFKNNGNLLIGTTTDGGQKLQVSGTAQLYTSNGQVNIAPESTTAQIQALRVSADATLRLTRSAVADWDFVAGTDLVIKRNNTTALTLDSSQNATFAGGIIGMTQGNVDNISDDGVASFTPLYNRGFIVINNPDYSQNALIAYFKAGSSYLLYSITKSADVTLNNSTTLTGTTGTDGKLNIGYNNSIIYIENRLGGIGNFQRYALGGTNN